MIGYLALTAPWHWVKNQKGELVQKRHDITYRLHQYPHPTVFKTAKNAMVTAGPDGQVLILDLNLLPILHLTALPDEQQGPIKNTWRKQVKNQMAAWDGEKKGWVYAAPEDIDAKLEQLTLFDGEIQDVPVDDIYEQHQIAERQLLLWENRFRKLDARIKKERGQ